MIEKPVNNPNPNLLMERLTHVMVKHGVQHYDPLVRAVDLAEEAYKKEPEVHRGRLIAVHLQVAGFIHPKLKAVELTGTVDLEHKVGVINELLKVLD